MASLLAPTKPSVSCTGRGSSSAAAPSSPSTIHGVKRPPAQGHDGHRSRASHLLCKVHRRREEGSAVPGATGKGLLHAEGTLLQAVVICTDPTWGIGVDMLARAKAHDTPHARPVQVPSVRYGAGRLSLAERTAHAGYGGRRKPS